MEKGLDRHGETDRGASEVENHHLLERHLGGDTAAFPELITMYRARVYSYLVRCGVGEGTRDDLFQEVFIKVHTAAATFQTDRPFNPWLFAIVANTVRSFYRKEKINRLVYKEEVFDKKGNSPTLHEEAEARETAVWLKKAIRQLPLNQRETFLLCTTENMKQQEVAAALGVPLNTVKTNLRRAKMALARALAERKLKESGEAAK